MLFQCRVPEKIQEAENVAFRISPQSRWRSFETPSLSAAEKIRLCRLETVTVLGKARSAENAEL